MVVKVSSWVNSLDKVCPGGRKYFYFYTKVLLQ